MPSKIEASLFYRGVLDGRGMQEGGRLASNTKHVSRQSPKSMMPLTLVRSSLMMRFASLASF